MPAPNDARKSFLFTLALALLWALAMRACEARALERSDPPVFL